jgi:hypothetical protein
MVAALTEAKGPHELVVFEQQEQLSSLRIGLPDG